MFIQSVPTHMAGSVSLKWPNLERNFVLIDPLSALISCPKIQFCLFLTRINASQGCFVARGGVVFWEH